MITPLDILPKNHRDKHILAGAPKDYSLCTAAPSPEKIYFLRGGGGCTQAIIFGCSCQYMLVSMIFGKYVQRCNHNFKLYFF